MVDTSGEPLREAVRSGLVDAVKPNREELGHCLSREITESEAPQAAAELLESVKTVLLTLGAAGAYAVTGEGTVGYRCRLRDEELGNTVGAGDAFLAGWLHARASGAGVADALRTAVAAGEASASSEATVGYDAARVAELRRRCEPLT